MRLLIVEDERKIADALKKGLAHEGFAVDAVYDGEDGLSYAEDESYDLIILDRMLPGLDGLELCRRLRAESSVVPILMLTAKDTVADRVDGLNGGADDYLVKPFAFEELLARVRTLLRRPPQLIDEELNVADLTINSRTLVAQRAGTQLALTKKEFALLEYLMRNQGRVVTKEMIMQHVWDFDADILPNTVEVYMGYLRAKIDKPFPALSPLLVTVRGFGYRIGGDDV